MPVFNHKINSASLNYEVTTKWTTYTASATSKTTKMISPKMTSRYLIHSVTSAHKLNRYLNHQL